MLRLLYLRVSMPARKCKDPSEEPQVPKPSQNGATKRSRTARKVEGIPDQLPWGNVDDGYAKTWELITLLEKRENGVVLFGKQAGEVRFAVSST